MLLRMIHMILRPFPGILKAAASLNDLHNTEKRLLGKTRPSVHGLLNKGPLFRCAVLQGMDQRKGDLSPLQIDPDLLSKFFFP